MDKNNEQELARRFADRWGVSTEESPPFCPVDGAFFKNEKLDELENITGLSFHKGAIHCGSFSSEKMNILFKDKKIESMAVTVVIAKNEIGLLMLGSYDRTKYLGDEDTTFIEYIRDVLEKKLEK